MKHTSFNIEVFDIIQIYSKITFVHFVFFKKKLKDRGEPHPANYVPSANKLSSEAKFINKHYFTCKVDYTI